MPTISLRQIEIFHGVMTTDNLTEAALLLQTSQPTVSRELARFEQLVQLKLFDRVRCRLYPTLQGLRLFEEVQRSYYGLNRIKQAAEGIRQFQHAQLSIACLPVFSQSLLPAVCKPFMDRYPGVSLSVIPQESPLLEEWLSAQRHDLGITENPQPPAGTVHHALMTINEVCVLPRDHPLQTKSVLTPQDFEGENFISLSVTDSYRQLLDNLFTEEKINRRLVMETHSAASICAMVRQGVGVSIVNPLTALDYMGRSANEGVCVRPFSVEIPFTISLIQPVHRPSSALVDTFIEHLKQQAITFQRHLAAVITC